MMKASNSKQMVSSTGAKLRSTPNVTNTNINANTNNESAIHHQNSSIPNSLVAYSTFAITHNNHLIEYCRTSMSALAGSTAGIIGLTSLYGFAFYFIMVLILWLMIMSKAGPNYGRYFTSSWGVLTNGFLGGLTTYVLFWTFLYGMVHVY